jgi:hypothetical protein
MGSAAIDEAESASATFPGIASVAVTEHDSGLGDHYLVAYGVPEGPGLNLMADARK